MGEAWEQTKGLELDYNCITTLHSTTWTNHQTTTRYFSAKLQKPPTLKY